MIVAGNLASLLATRERYEKEIPESKNAKLSNIEAHNKCYNLLPDFISECLSFGIKINYILPVDSQFKIVPVRDGALDLLQKFREESNGQVSLNYDVRMNNIKRSMINRNAPQEQFDELGKVESIYLKMNNCNNNGMQK